MAHRNTVRESRRPLDRDLAWILKYGRSFTSERLATATSALLERDHSAEATLGGHVGLPPSARSPAAIETSASTWRK